MGKKAAYATEWGKPAFGGQIESVWFPEYLCGQGKGWGMGRSSELLHLTDTYGAVSLERVVRGSRAVVSSQSLVSQSLQSTETQVVTVPMSVMDFTLPLIPQVTSGS